jgi:dUTP pyrophosphatase
MNSKSLTEKGFIPVTTNTVKFKKLHPDAIIPKRMSEKASGLDLFACLDASEAMIPSGSYKIITTGISMELPEGYEAQVRSRSGLTAKYGVFVLNSPGTIDEDYRGEIKVILYNSDMSHQFFVEQGDRIAQLVISKVSRLPYMEVAELSTTERGEGGLGSTGI